MESPYLEIFGTHLDTFLCYLLQESALAGGWAQGYPEVPSNSCDFVIMISVHIVAIGIHGLKGRSTKDQSLVS